MIRFHPSIIRFIVGIVSFVLCIGLGKSLLSHVFRDDVVAQRQRGILNEQERNEELKRRLKEATSSAFIEKVAREKLGMVREGDTVILLDTSRIQSKSSGQHSSQQSNWSKWWSLFF